MTETKGLTILQMRGKMRVPVCFIGLIMAVCAGGGKVFALHNHYGAHDPSSIIKCEDTYWVFATGNGIYSMYSKNLVEWTAGTTPFPVGYYPSWVLNYVPAFGGHFWAPECFYMNGQYHLYYSCSSWGIKQSAIGLLTSKSLNPGTDDYFWQDEGVVVYSNSSSEANCIDPSVFRDDDGRIWLTYGSYFGGIRIVELDSVTGKVSGSYHYPVASSDCEASYVINGKDYYYLFINRGTCCQGVSSTYHIMVGRSASPTGPFYDKLGYNLNQGGGSTILGTSGNFIGPGHTGYFTENNTEWLTFHYYDGDDAGVPKMSVANLRWSDDGWPYITNDWIEDGYYSIINKSSQLAWDIDGNGADQDPVILGTYTQAGSQKWRFEALGNGFYNIIPAGLDLVTELNSCTASIGTKISLGVPESKSCEIWRIEKANDLSLFFSSKYGNRVLEVPAASNQEGSQLQVNYFSGEDNQRWMIGDTFTNVSVKDIEGSCLRFQLYPNPVPEGNFRIEFDRPVEECDVRIFTCDGKTVFSDHYSSLQLITVNTKLKRQVYLLNVKIKNDFFFQKLIVL